VERIPTETRAGVNAAGIRSLGVPSWKYRGHRRPAGT
jgi:hypothetical protein